MSNDEENDEQRKADYTRAAEAARMAVRARGRAIISHPEAKGREALAQHIAVETEMTVDEAILVLKAAARVAT